jgi:hypothetical protein
MELKIETTKKKAEITCSDESRLNGNFFVSLRAPNHEGNELVLDLLLSEKTYLPFELDEGKIVLLQKGCIVMVVLKVREMKMSTFYQQKIPAKVHLLSGKTIEGEVYSDLPRTHARLSDFLNQSKVFFYLEVGDKDYLVNSQFVKIVRPIPSK